jgi:hypothetical protein
VREALSVSLWIFLTLLPAAAAAGVRVDTLSLIDRALIPPAAEQAKLGMKVVKLPATLHNDMGDSGTEQQKAEIIRYIGAFLGVQTQ